MCAGVVAVMVPPPAATASFVAATPPTVTDVAPLNPLPVMVTTVPPVVGP